MDWTGSSGSGAERSPRVGEQGAGGGRVGGKRKLPNLLNSELYTAEQVRASPSRKHGISEVLEGDYRRRSCLFIKAAGKALDLPVEGIATALVYFHKFFMLHSFKDHERFVVATACIFLAAKVEESGKRVDEVVSKCHGVWTNWELFSETEKPFKRLREKVLIAERCVLHTISFRMTVEHPYATVLELLKVLFAKGRGADRRRGCPDKALNRRVLQAAQSFVNDSLLTTLCLQYRPFDVAAAVVYLSYLFVGLPRIDTTMLCLRRGDSPMLQTDEFTLAAICDTILSLYDEHGAGHAVAVASSLRDAVHKRVNASPSATTAPLPTTTPSPRPTPSPSPQTPGVGNHAPTPGRPSAGHDAQRSSSSDNLGGTFRSRANGATDPRGGLPRNDGAVAGSGGTPSVTNVQQAGTEPKQSSVSEGRATDERVHSSTDSVVNRAGGKGREGARSAEWFAEGDPRGRRTSSSGKGSSSSSGSANRKRKSSSRDRADGDLEDVDRGRREAGGGGLLEKEGDKDGAMVSDANRERPL